MFNILKIRVKYTTMEVYVFKHESDLLTLLKDQEMTQ